MNNMQNRYLQKAQKIITENDVIEELKEEQEMERAIKKYIGIQLANLELLDQQVNSEKSIKDDIFQKCKYMNSLIQQKQNQIECLQLMVQNKVASQGQFLREIFQKKAQLESEIDFLNSKRKELAESIDPIKIKINNYEGFELLKKIQEKQRQKIFQLNEELLSLKGKIRVVCRIRPLKDISYKTIQVIDDYKLLLQNPSKSLQSPDKKSKNIYTEHTFMKVYENARQIDIFNDLNFFLCSFLSGSNVCIFTYGPTGSGKTFTMFGNLNDKSLKGIIPRSVEQLCVSLEEYNKNGWQSDVSVSIVELYNDKIKDLIKNETITERKEPFQSKLPQNLDFNQKHQYLMSQITTATKNRIVRRTKCNQKSSRSHLVFTIKLKLINTQSGNILEGSLNLVDLAGSERIQLSQTTGEGQKETIFINQSLQALSAVIKSIKNNEIHISYRNSLLTQYLRNYLNSQSKTMVILTVSSHPKFYAQTKDSLNLLSLKQQQHTTRSQQQSPIQQQDYQNNSNNQGSTDKKCSLNNKKLKILEKRLSSISSTQKTLIL